MSYQNLTEKIILIKQMCPKFSNLKQIIISQLKIILYLLNIHTNFPLLLNNYIPNDFGNYRTLQLYSSYNFMLT